MVYITDLQKRCEKFIQDAHIKINQFCKIIGISRQAYYGWINGEPRLSDATLDRIANYLDSPEAKELIEQNSKYIPVPDAAHMVGLSGDKIRSLCSCGIVDSKRPGGGRWLVNIESLEEYARKHQNNRLSQPNSGMLVFGELFSDFDVFWKPVLSCNNSYEIFFPDRHEYDHQYWVSNAGYIYNDTTGELLGNDAKRKGYIYVNLRKNGERVTRLVHLLVAYNFCPNGHYKEFVHHIDGNKQNNHASNLVWVTEAEHRKCHQLMKKNKKAYRKYINTLKKDNQW